MTWNYRIVQRLHNGETFYALHEVYYDEAGNPTGRTKNPTDFGSGHDEGPESIIFALEMAIESHKKHGILIDLRPDD